MVAGNWKMNGSQEFVTEISNALASADFSSIDVVVCPPACFLPLFAQRKFDLAAQNVSAFDSGAYTGEISANMLFSLGCDYVIVGHSERREGHNESSQAIADKALAALNAGVAPIICVGEPLEVRENGEEEAFVKAQLEPILLTLSDDQLKRCVLAYEPIWAIGTGKTATPEQAQAMHKFIRETLAQRNELVAGAMQILYGGSVKPDNAQDLFAREDIDGGLIGGASLNADSFLSICQAAS
jgi:triosephosphate isomerase